MLSKRFLIGIPVAVTVIAILILTLTSINSLNQNTESQTVTGTSLNVGTNHSSAGGVLVKEGQTVGNLPSPLQPLFTTKIVPDQITMTRGSSADVTVYLNYKYVPGVNAPNQLVVNMYPDKSYTLLNIWANVPPDTVQNWIDTYEANGKSPPGLYNKTQLESYPSPGPIVINANETKSVTMRITIPPNYPDDFLNRSMMLNAVPTYPDRIMGISGEVTVKVIG
jgi:hypothetical protein